MSHASVTHQYSDTESQKAPVSHSVLNAVASGDVVPISDTSLAFRSFFDAVRLAVGAPIVTALAAPEDSWTTFFDKSGKYSVPHLPEPLSSVLLRSVQASASSLLVEDTRSHPLIKSIPIVDGVRVLSCLIAPVRGEDKQVRGLLCALDSVPRWWAAKDQALLEKMADVASALLISTVENTTAISDGNNELLPDIEKATWEPVEPPANAVAAIALDSLTDAVVLTNSRWSVLWGNRAIADMFGIDHKSIANTDIRDSIGQHANASVRAAWRRAIETGQPVDFTWQNISSGRWYDGYASPGKAGLAIVIRDVTNSRIADDSRLKTTQSNSESRKLESVATLAGGVAHDFNNLLTVISANTELLQQSHISEVVSNELDSIHSAALRAADLVRLLIAFSQQSVLEPEVLSLNALIGGMEGTIRHLLPAGVRVETSFCSESTRIFADALQLEQTVVRLIRNSGYAMPNGGVLRISTTVQELSCDLHATPDLVPAGEWVVLSITDSGIGIPPENIGRVFEPFFTTRQPGEGPGLGLAATHGIIAQSGGACTVESSLGNGCTINLWLPMRNLITGGHHY